MLLNKITNFYLVIIHKILDLIFPRYCSGCQQAGTWLCPGCLSKIPISWSESGDNIFSVFDYDNKTIKKSIWSLKYKRALDLAQIFAPLLAINLLDELADKLITSEKIILLPVPLSPRRFRQRGYNQAQELAKQMQAINPQQFELKNDLLKKIKNTPTQVSLQSRAQRLSNLKQAFAIKEHKAYAPNQVFVIVDDVSTTGATINEIRHALKHHGYTQTYGLVIARSDG